MFMNFAEMLAFDNDDDDLNIDDEVQDDDDDGQNGDDDGQDEGEGGDSGKAKKSGEERVFTQAEVDKMIVKRNKQLKEKYTTLEQQYKDTLKQKDLTAEQRAKTESDLEQLRSQMRTTKEEAEYQARKAQKEHERQLQSVSEQADFYKDLYERTTIERAISDATHQHGGFSPQQFVAYLAPKTKIVDELDPDGQKTGALVPRVDWTIYKEDGTREVVSKTPSEAISLMKEDTEQFGNMFKDYVSAGIGSGTAPSANGVSRKFDPKKINVDEYMKMTAEERKSIGLR